MKLIKRLLKILVALVLLVVLAAVALVFVFDPNVFKPRIESLAQEQGVHLNIDGNLGWQLWPSLGVEVNGIRVAAELAPDDEIARLEKASLRVAIRPLLRGEVVIHHIDIDGAALDLRVDANGVGNWEALLPDDEAPAPEPVAMEEAEGEALELAVERISLSNASLRYRDAGTGQDLELSPLNLTISEFNLQGRPFNLDLGVLANVTDRELLGDQPLQIEATLSSRITLAEDFDNLQLDDGRLRLDLERDGASDDIRLTLSARADNLLAEPQFQGELALRSFNPRELMAVLSLPAPEMADAGALTRVALNMTFSGDPKQVSIDPLRIELDDTTIEGRVAVTDIERGALRVNLRGDRINIDDYLPPPSEEETVEEPEATGDEELIPLELVRELDLEFILTFDALTVMDLAMQNLNIRVVASEGVIDLEQAQLQLYDGRVDAGGRLDATGETALLNLVAQLAGLQIGPLLSDLEFDEQVQFSGALNFDTRAETRGTTMNQLMETLDAEANFSGAEVRMAPLNIEEKFCQVVNLVTRSEGSDRSWPEYTDMTALSGRAVIKDQILTVESMEAGIDQLALQVRGTANMKEDSYDFTLPLRLGSEKTSEGGCRITSNYWIDRSLSLLRCRGSIEGLNPVSDCRPDTRALERLVREFAEYRVREQHGDRIDAERDRAEERAREERARAEAEAAEQRRRADEKVEEEKRRLEDRVRERAGGDDDESTEDRVRNLFRR